MPSHRHNPQPHEPAPITRPNNDYLVDPSQVKSVHNSTPYDTTVAHRIGERLTWDTDRQRYTGFLVPKDTSLDPKPPVIPESERIQAPRWWDLPGRATRYLEVVQFAGKTVLGEQVHAAAQASGTTRDYVRSSFPNTQQTAEPSEKYAGRRNPTDLSGDGAFKETFGLVKEKPLVPKPLAPITRRQRRAVSRIEQARRDAAIAAGEAREIEHARKPSREAERLGKRRTGNDRVSDRYQRGYNRRMHRKMRKAARIADGRHITGRIAKVFAAFDK